MRHTNRTKLDVWKLMNHMLIYEVFDVSTNMLRLVGCRCNSFVVLLTWTLEDAAVRNASSGYVKLNTKITIGTVSRAICQLPFLCWVTRESGDGWYGWQGGTYICVHVCKRYCWWCTRCDFRVCMHGVFGLARHMVCTKRSICRKPAGLIGLVQSLPVKISTATRAVCLRLKSCVPQLYNLVHEGCGLVSLRM